MAQQIGDDVPFNINRSELLKTGRVVLGEWTDPLIYDLSSSISRFAEDMGSEPVQRGRVIALRRTDKGSLSSAFKSALYHSKYHDMANTDRFERRIAAAHQSYEPIRGESIAFLYVGVGKPVYDALAMFGQGRLARISAGFHHSIPWGVEVPVGLADVQGFADRMMPAVRKVVELAEAPRSGAVRSAALREARYELPICYVVPPFLMEFSEEALLTKVFVQRLWEPGVGRRDSGAVVGDMWECCCELDDRFSRLYDYHGPHVRAWEDALRALRDGEMGVEELQARLSCYDASSEAEGSPAYRALMSALGLELEARF